MAFFNGPLDSLGETFPGQRTQSNHREKSNAGQLAMTIFPYLPIVPAGLKPKELYNLHTRIAYEAPSWPICREYQSAGQSGRSIPAAQHRPFTSSF
jgi:hypothetical protein